MFEAKGIVTRTGGDPSRVPLPALDSSEATLACEAYCIYHFSSA